MLLLEFIIIINKNELGVGKGIYHPATYPLSGIEDCIVKLKILFFIIFIYYLLINALMIIY